MSNYKIGRVYKIMYIGNENVNITYIGSTLNTLRDRWMSHKYGLKNKNNKVSIYKTFEKYGIENFKIFLIKEYEVVDRKHLQMYEQLWINKIKNINLNSSFQILNKERQKLYYKNNKDDINIKRSEYNKNYKLENKDLLNSKSKMWRDNNKEKVKEYNKKNKEKITCECGAVVGILVFNYTHLKTKKHIKYINSLV
jgi:hypothetical protein